MRLTEAQLIEKYLAEGFPREISEAAAKRQIEEWTRGDENDRRAQEDRKQAEAKAREESERAERKKAERDATRKAEAESRKREALEKLSGRDVERPWIIEPYLLARSLTKIVATANELPVAGDFMAELAAKIDGDIVLATNTPGVFVTKFVAAGGDRERLKFIKELDFSHPGDDDREALIVSGIAPRLYIFPNLLEYVPKSGSQSFSQDVLRQLRNMADSGAAVVFGWPSSTRRHAAGCGLWTSAGDVKLTLADVRPVNNEAQGSKREFAQGLVIGALDSGPRTRKEMLALAERHGIGRTTLQEAAQDIVSSARSKKEFGEAVWSLRQPNENVHLAAAISTVGALS